MPGTNPVKPLVAKLDASGVSIFVAMLAVVTGRVPVHQF